MTRTDREVPQGHPVDPESRIVLGPDDIARALRRIAHEILESNKGAEDLVLLGIPSRGVALARRLAELIEEVEGTAVPVGSLDITLHRDDLRNQPTRTPMRTEIPDCGVDDRVVVLVDDVLYSGRSVRAALDALSDLGRPRAVRLAVLVEPRLEVVGQRRWPGFAGPGFARPARFPARCHLSDLL